MKDKIEPYKIDIENPINQLAISTAVHSLEFLLPPFKRVADEEEDYFMHEQYDEEYAELKGAFDTLNRFKRQIDNLNVMF